MDSLKNLDIASHLPDFPSFSLPTDVVSHPLDYLQTQLARLELLQAVDRQQLAVTGLVLFIVLVLVIAFKKWRQKGDETKNKTPTVEEKKTVTGIPKPEWKKPDLLGNKKDGMKVEQKTWKKPLGVKNIKDEIITSTSTKQLEKPDQKDYMKVETKAWKKPLGVKNIKVEIITSTSTKQLEKSDQKDDVKVEPKTWKKPLVIKNIKDETKTPTSTQKLEKPDQKETKIVLKAVPVTSEFSSTTPDLTNKVDKVSELKTNSDQTKTTSESIKDEINIQEEKTKSNWDTKKEAEKNTVVHKRQLIIRPERDEKKEAEEFEKELKETERRAEAEAKSLMKPVNLNIDKNARSKQESKKIKEREVNLVKKMCVEFRDVAKLDGQEVKEEKRKEMEKVRSARSYFKTVDKYRSESMSAVPRTKFTSEEDCNNSSSRGSNMRLSQFEPGKINSRFTNMFGGDSQTDSQEKQKPPKKKLITLDQVMKKNNDDEEEGPQAEMGRELEELRQARKNWVPPEENRDFGSEIKEDITSIAKLSSTSVKNRWKPVNSERQDKTRSMEVPQKLNIENVFINDTRDDTEDTKMEVEKELNEIREARPTPLSKRWKPKQYQKPAERSKSAHVLQRVKLEDNSWVVEKSESRLEEERRKALQELEFVKKARMESLEVIENLEVDRPSSRLKFETMKELEEVKKTRTEAKNYEPNVNEMIGEMPNNRNVATFGDVLEKQNVEKMENTKKKIDSHSYEISDVKSVRFNEPCEEKEVSVEKNTEEDNIKFENKVKLKLKQIKNQTEKEVSKLTNMKSKPMQNIENERERASREEKDSSENKTDTSASRNRSLSRIRTAGKKVKDLTNEQLKKITKTKPKKNPTA
eukprot:GFUD01028274.1.p1 GENE.GFUD01028274.1~~GFUD01028274.1.p1  ORF type:complete len:865 (+),score=347.60 GFUD01028274.1:153-2747(+)